MHGIKTKADPSILTAAGFNRVILVILKNYYICLRINFTSDLLHSRRDEKV